MEKRLNYLNPRMILSSYKEDTNQYSLSTFCIVRISSFKNYCLDSTFKGYDSVGLELGLDINILQLFPE